MILHRITLKRFLKYFIKLRIVKSILIKILTTQIKTTKTNVENFFAQGLLCQKLPTSQSNLIGMNIEAH